jgi:hypothetical protein
MSTLGIAHHQRGTFPIVDEDAARSARRARYAAKDAAYRAALRLGGDQPLPSALGITVHGCGPRTRNLPTGGRMRRQIVTI